jgi:hypothetical protein
MAQAAIPSAQSEMQTMKTSKQNMETFRDIP